MARKKKTDAVAAAATAANAAPGEETAKKAEKKAAADAAASASLASPTETETRAQRGGGGTVDGGAASRGRGGAAGQKGEKDGGGKTVVAPGSSNGAKTPISGGDRTKEQQEEDTPEQAVEGNTRVDLQSLTATQRKNLKRKLRKQEQKQQEAAVLAAVRGVDAASASLSLGLGGEGAGGEQNHGKMGATGAKAAVGKMAAAVYAEQEQALRKRLEALKMKRFSPSNSSNNNQSLSNDVAAAGDSSSGGGGKKEGGRRPAATAGEIEALILEVDAILEQEDALLRKPLRKRVGVEQLQQQVRDMEQQIQKLHKEVQRKTAAAATAQQVLQQRTSAAGAGASSSSSHAAATAAAKAEELEAERSRLEEVLRYVSHLREQLVLTQQQQEFRNFYDRMQAFKAECAATLRSLSHPAHAGGKGGAAAGYRAGGGGAGFGGGSGGFRGDGGSAAAGGSSSMNGVAAAAGYYSPAKEAQWCRRLQELANAASRAAADASSSSPGQTAPPPRGSNSNKTSSPSKASAASNVSAEEEEDETALRRGKQGSPPLLLQTVSLGADAMSLVFPGAAAGGSSSKLPLVRKIERAHQVVLEKQQGGGGRGGTVLIVGHQTTAIQQCAAALAVLDESMQPDKRSKYRIEAAEGCSIGGVIGARGGNLRRLEEECGVVVWAEGTEFIVIAPAYPAIQKGLERLKELMASSQNFSSGGGEGSRGGGAAGTASVTVTLPVAVARACLSPALRSKIRGIESQHNCSIRVILREANGSLVVSGADAAAAAAGGKALQEATAHLDVRFIPAEAEKVARLVKTQNSLSFNPAARERRSSGVAWLRGEEGLLLVGPVEGGVLDEAQQAATEALQQLSKVTENVLLTHDQLRVLSRAERTAIEKKTGAHFRMPPRVGGGSNSSGAGGMGGYYGGKKVGGAGDATAAGGEKGKVALSLIGRSEEVKHAQELVEEVLREKGHQEVVEACRELTMALLAERGAEVRKLEEVYEVSVSIERQEKRVVVRGARERVQECAAELRQRQEQLLHLQLQQQGAEGAGSTAANVASGAAEHVHSGAEGSSNGIADIVVQRVPIRRSQVAAFIGKQGLHVRGLQASSGVDSIRVDETEGSVIIRGSPQAVTKGVQLVTESLAGAGVGGGSAAAAAGGGGLEQQQQSRGRRSNAGAELYEDENGSGGRRPTTSTVMQQQQQLNGDSTSASGGYNGGQSYRARRGGGKDSRQFDQGQQHEQQENYSSSAAGGGGAGKGGSYFSRRGGGAGTRGRRGGGGFGAGGAQQHNNRSHEQQQPRAPPVSMDASDEIAFPSLEDAQVPLCSRRELLDAGTGVALQQQRLSSSSKGQANRTAKKEQEEQAPAAEKVETQLEQLPLTKWTAAAAEERETTCERTVGEESTTRSTAGA